jgi:hypothetical protein|tara:strand:+ start:142 stop:273 length:132 start_codon:yes stop_codon:yes gene_type:complete
MNKDLIDRKAIKKEWDSLDADKRPTWEVWKRLKPEQREDIKQG